jgi:D-alanyl-D-alanine carboxypeptidase/D-alanyl-D-alanine-endopeptidase (penicillin-binding protein 4)
MKKVFLLAGFSLLGSVCFAQTITAKLQKAFQQFEADSQLKHAISSLYVIDAATGQVVFDKNSQIGLAPASTQKIITSVTAFELLGKDYRYKTEFRYDGTIRDSLLIGNIYIKGSGDPTLGSWRYSSVSADAIKKRFLDELSKRKIYKQRGSLVALSSKYATNKIPDGWIWQDIGNYYGSGSGELNWNENQFDLFLRPGKKEGDEVTIVGTNPVINNGFQNELKSGSKGSGDNGYIYFQPETSKYYVNGTVPCCVDSFKISGSAMNSDLFTLNQFANYLWDGFKEDKVSFHIYILKKELEATTPMFSSYSPSLDSIVYWFNKKSINLYGEALIKTFAYEKQGFGSTDSGVAILKKFWKEKGLDEDELNMADGSGLSPLNRVTTHAQVEILKYAKTKDWFPYFYDALPEYNAMKMKSGTISDVKGFCGYHKAKNGKEYIFSFLVNNYNGKSSQLVSKMYKVLDELK